PLSQRSAPARRPKSGDRSRPSDVVVSLGGRRRGRTGPRALRRERAVRKDLRGTGTDSRQGSRNSDQPGKAIRLATAVAERLMIRLLQCALMIGLAACNDSSAPEVPLPGALKLVPIVSGLSSPLFLTAPPGDSRLFIVEQPGRIRVVKNGQMLTTPYLNIASKLTSGGERGLLGLAFHPSFATNGFLYVYYTD